MGDAPRPGELIERVEARGKHLLIHFEGGLTLRTHLRMTGSWHLYRAGERWRKPAYLARAVVGADSGWLAVCFQAPVVETYRRVTRSGETIEPPALAVLGPDLAADDPDLDEAVRRAQTVGREVSIADLLLDQRVAAGIGNVYKSDVCFLHGLHPLTPARDVPPALLRRLFQTAHRLLVANLDGGRRVTYEGGLAVYGRSGRPCRRCGTPVRSARSGPMARQTYWCPTCQPPPTS